MKNVVVTGANGFIGTNLVHELLMHNIRVICILEKKFQDEPFFEGKKNVRKIFCDVKNYDDLPKLIDVIPDVFYHLAWQGVNGIQKGDFEIQTHNVLMAIKAASVASDLHAKKFIALGTVSECAALEAIEMGVYPSNLLYGLSKNYAHQLLNIHCNTLNLPFIWAQLANVFGEGNLTGNLLSYTISMIKEKNSPTFSSGLQPYDFLYIGDCVNALYLLGKCECQHNNYFVGSGSPCQLKKYLESVGEIIDSDVPLLFGQRPDDGIVWNKDWYSIKALQRDTGFTPKTSFEDGIRRCIIE